MNRLRIVVIAGVLLFLPACADRPSAPTPVDLPDVREAVALDSAGERRLRAIMLQHLESVDAIVAALAEKDFDRARVVTEQHLGFFMHRQAMAAQRPEDFPPRYHDLAQAHHAAAEELAAAMPTRDYERILPRFDALLKSCIACHHAYRAVPRG